MSIYADHWLYRYIPCNHDELKNKPCWQAITWGIFGNDDDGIFGEGPHSGTKWTGKWGGKTVKNISHIPGTINFQRFILWQLRNPLHNFTNYVIGFKGKEDVSYKRIALISTGEIKGYEDIDKPHVFPMGERTGVYLGLHNNLPFVSARVKIIGRWLETYSGWRPGGGFGLLALRLKTHIKDRH
ncbi:MAG TPA: hypothetical protein VGP47_10120 [Parachlamydiaceae bacterium]|nr:hypothetical protein [Parachlamydiaceae bacterium]